MVKRGNIPLFNQLVDSLDSAMKEFEFAYETNNYDYFVDIKKLIIKLQEEINRISE